MNRDYYLRSIAVIVDDSFVPEPSIIFQEISAECGYEVSLEELIQSYLLGKNFIPSIKRVIYNGPATIVFWQDGTKTVAKCSSKDSFSELAGLNVCFLKKMMGEEEYKKLVIDRVEE